MATELMMSNSRQATMSSREIAELTSKQHKHVKRDIETMLAELGKDGSSFGRIYRDSMNRQQTEYHLDRELTEILITGYSIPLRAKVIRRLHELEQQAPAVPKTLPEALRLAADLADRCGQLQTALDQQQPKVVALSRLTDTDGTLCMTDAAKHLGVQRKELLDWMRDNRWIYRRANSARWIAYEPRLTAGLLEHRVTVIGHDDESRERLASQVRVTPKGLAALASRLGRAV